jgi:hypothetical protein
VSKKPFRLLDVAPYAPLALIGGALVGFLIRGMKWDVGPLIGGAMIGFSCFAAAVLAEYLFHDWFERHPQQWWRRAIAYFLASQAGWLLPVFVIIPILTGEGLNIRVGVRGSVVVVALALSAAGTLVGLAVYGYETLKTRLAASIEQLKEKEFAEKELELARALQSRMLPAPEITADGYRISARNFAARYVAGDFYDVFQYGDAVGIAIADVAGKGIAASLIMASVKAVLPLLAMNRSVDEAVNALNEKLVGELSKREFVALALARYEPLHGRVSFVNAGLPDPYVLRGGSIEAMEVTGPRLPLGLRRGTRYEARDVTLAEGEAMIFFSDGLPEATASDGELLGYERLSDIVRAAGPDADAILERLHAVTTEARDDDQTLVIVQRR